MGSKLQGAINAGIIGLVVIVVLFQAYAVIVPVAGAASDDMNDSNRCATVGCSWNTTGTAFCADGTNTSAVCTAANQSIPLGNLFNPTGVIYIIVMIGLLLVAIKGFMPGKK